MQLTTTGRGFAIAEFTDHYNKKCSIQKSSLATEDCIWLGIEMLSARMHLTQQMVRDLLPLLQQFADTGELYEGKTPTITSPTSGDSLFCGIDTAIDPSLPEGTVEIRGKDGKVRGRFKVEI